MKKITFIVGGILLLLLGWFLFIKKYDHRFHFQAQYDPAVVNRELKEFSAYEVFKSKPEVGNTASEEDYSLDQKLQFGDLAMQLHWELEKESDSTTAVYLHVAGPDKFKNRLQILNPFQKSSYLDSLTVIFSEFGKALKRKQNSYRITITDSIVYSPSLDCICKSAENIEVKNKALQMVKDINYLEDFVLANDLKLTGYPFIKINSWDRAKDIINFDFCFPVNLAQDIRPNGIIEFQQFSGATSLKAIYNGNYRNSDISWYSLLDTSQKRHLQTSGLPLEIFHNNPREGSDALSWKAEIYLPVVE